MSAKLHHIKVNGEWTVGARLYPTIDHNLWTALDYADLVSPEEIGPAIPAYTPPRKDGYYWIQLKDNEVYRIAWYNSSNSTFMCTKTVGLNWQELEIVRISPKLEPTW